MAVVVAAARGELDAVPSPILILGGIASVQFGSAFATTLFDRAGPAGVVLLRLALAALVLLPITRPRLIGRPRRQLLAAAGFGLVLAAMNWSFYEALDRLPLGPAVTVEFAGPLTVAILGSRRLLDLLWAALAGGGVALLAFAGSDGSGSGRLDPGGLALALLAACCWAGYILHVAAGGLGLHRPAGAGRRARGGRGADGAGRPGRGRPGAAASRACSVAGWRWRCCPR